MLARIVSALLLLSALPAIAQTTVTPTVNGQDVTLQFPAPGGGSWLVTLPYVVTLSVSPASASGGMIGVPYVQSAAFGAATVTYTAPPPPPPPPAPPVAPAIPASATAVSLLTQGTWKPCEHDAGTPGTAPTCSNTYPVTGIFSDSARNFSMSYTGAGGVRWANSLAKDTAATHFVLDIQVQSPDWSHVADLELDDNQVKADGKTAILGVQCASQEKAWDVTLLTSAGKWHWVPTNVACNPLTWAPNTPHHVRIFGTIDAKDISTYTGVEFDGVYAPFAATFTGNTGDALGWSVGTVLTNLQIDGYGASGSATVYVDKFTIYRW